MKTIHGLTSLLTVGLIVSACGDPSPNRLGGVDNQKDKIQVLDSQDHELVLVTERSIRVRRNQTETSIVNRRPLKFLTNLITGRDDQREFSSCEILHNESSMDRVIRKNLTFKLIEHELSEVPVSDLSTSIQILNDYFRTHLTIEDFSSDQDFYDYIKSEFDLNVSQLLRRKVRRELMYTLPLDLTTFEEVNKELKERVNPDISISSLFDQESPKFLISMDLKREDVQISQLRPPYETDTLNIVCKSKEKRSLNDLESFLKSYGKLKPVVDVPSAENN